MKEDEIQLSKLDNERERNSVIIQGDKTNKGWKRNIEGGVTCLRLGSSLGTECRCWNSVFTALMHSIWVPLPTVAREPHFSHYF